SSTERIRRSNRISDAGQPKWRTSSTRHRSTDDDSDERLSPLTSPECPPHPGAGDQDSGDQEMHLSGNLAAAGDTAQGMSPVAGYRLTSCARTERIPATTPSGVLTYPGDSASPDKDDTPPGVIFTAIAAGPYHNCAIDTRGDIWCWGYNPDGRLGVGTDGDERDTPTLVNEPGVTFTYVSLSLTQTCALNTT